MRITWLGHACFKVQTGDAVLVIDPYEDGTVNGLKNLRETANQVLCSHEHFDHNGRNTISLVATEQVPFQITKISTYHDDQGGAARGANLIHLIEDGSYRIAHLGDLGCDLEEEQVEMLKNLDAVMIPVGGFFTIDAQHAAKIVKQIQPKLVIPMHYRDDSVPFGFDVIGTVESFLESMGSGIRLDCSEIDLAKQYEDQVIVLKPSYL